MGHLFLTSLVVVNGAVMSCIVIWRSTDPLDGGSPGRGHLSGCGSKRAVSDVRKWVQTIHLRILSQPFVDLWSCDLWPDGATFHLHIVPLGHDCSIRLWNMESRTCIQEFTAHRRKFHESIHDVAFHPTKCYVGSAGADALAKVFMWHVPSGMDKRWGLSPQPGLVMVLNLTYFCLLTKEAGIKKSKAINNRQQGSG